MKKEKQPWKKLTVKMLIKGGCERKREDIFEREGGEGGENGERGK